MAVIHVHVQPRSSRNEIVRQEGDVWWVRLAAPPVEGKANAALVAYLSEVLDIPRSQITITRGLSSRQKAVAVEGLLEAEAHRRLGEAVARRG